MPLWFTSGIISSVEGICLDVPLTRPLVISHNYFAAARKIIYQTSSAKQVRLSVSKTCHFLRIVKLWPIFKDAEVPCHEKLALEALRYQSSSSKAQGGYLGFQVDFAVISPLRFHDTS